METIQTQTEKPCFETVWAILQRNAQQLEKLGKYQEEMAQEMKERQAETDRLLKESKKEADRQMRESKKEADRQMKDFNKRFGEFTNRFGEVVEYMIAPNMRQIFKEIGYDFNQAGPHYTVEDDVHDIYFEIDVFLQNGDTAILVEVKTKLSTRDVKDHIKRLQKMRAFADFRGDKRAFLGAVAGVVMTKETKKYALDQGFFVIEPSGETMSITVPAGKPKEW